LVSYSRRHTLPQSSQNPNNQYGHGHGVLIPPPIIGNATSLLETGQLSIPNPRYFPTTGKIQFRKKLNEIFTYIYNKTNNFETIKLIKI
jgi:hypothetical protein